MIYDRVSTVAGKDNESVESVEPRLRWSRPAAAASTFKCSLAFESPHTG
jgi:hypothetical protein